MDGIIFISVIVCLICLAISLKAWHDFINKKRELHTHISEHTATGRLDDLHKKESATERLLKKVFYYADDFASLGHRINFFSETQDVERWLMQAGYPIGLTAERFQGMKIFFTLVGFVLGVFALIIGLPLSQLGVVLLPIAGYFTTIMWLRNKAKARQAELGYVLPDFLDTVSVTLQAGVGLDQALRDIIPYFDGPIREELSRFNQQISLGVQREQAYRELLSRNDNPEFQSLIKSLMQGSRLGVPVATTFKIQADEMRRIKKEKIKETAAKASPKVTLITTFIVMPAAMILIGGLMVINLFSDNMGMFDLFN